MFDVRSARMPDDGRVDRLVRLAHLTALRSRGVHDGRQRVVGCAGDIPECFPTTPLRTHPSGLSRRSGPTRVYRVRAARTRLMDGRKRAPPLCANPRRTTGRVTRRSERGPDPRPPTNHDRPLPPPHRPPYAIPRALTYVVITIAQTVVVVVVVVIPKSRLPKSRGPTVGRRPPVVNTCSVCEHAVHVISASVG